MPNEIRFGVDCVVLGPRAAKNRGPEYCLCCNDELIFIDAAYSLEVLRRHQESLNKLKDVLSDLLSCSQGLAEREFKKRLDGPLNELNHLADLTTPYRIWFIKPEKRGEPETPPGMQCCILLEEFATTCMAILKSGTSLTENASCILEAADQLILEIQKTVLDDHRLVTAAICDNSDCGHITCERQDTAAAADNNKGVSLYDIGSFFEEDEICARSWVKRYADSKLKATAIGKCPKNGRAYLYRLSEILSEVVGNYNLSASRKERLQKHLESRIRAVRK